MIRYICTLECITRSRPRIAVSHVSRLSSTTRGRLCGAEDRLGSRMQLAGAVADEERARGSHESADAGPGRRTPRLAGTRCYTHCSDAEEVELTLINKLDDPHGFQIADVGIEEVVQPKAQMTVTFTATQPGAHNYICHLHPPHLGCQMLVLRK